MRPLATKGGSFRRLCFVLWISATSTAAGQTSTKPLFTDYPPWLCVGGGFVAMVPLSRPQPLMVIRIGAKGIEAPQTISTTNNEVRGLQCSGSHIELLVREGESDHFSILEFNVQESAINAGLREDLNWSISRKAATPPTIEHTMDTFDWIGSRAGSWMRGDWFVEVPRNDNLGHIYEVHFVRTEARGMVKLEVTLLEETLGRKKVTRSIPLVRFEASDASD